MVIGWLANKVAPRSVVAESFFPPPSKFHVEDIPDLTGKVAIVTGANVGIGYETAKALLQRNAKVYVACRSQVSADSAIKQLREQTGKQAVFLELDLSDLRKVKAAANAFLRYERRLDILINDAGVMATPIDMLTADKFDLQFGTNVLGHYYFTELLVPALKASKETTGVLPRVINTSSYGHTWAPPETVNFDSLEDGPQRQAVLKKWGSRATWKEALRPIKGNIILSAILNDQHGDILIAASAHPGGIRSALTRHGSQIQQRLANMILHPMPMGALTQLYAATVCPESELRNTYFVPWARIGHADPRTSNAELRDKLKKWMDAQIARIA